MVRLPEEDGEPEVLAVTDRNHHRIGLLDPRTQAWVAWHGEEGQGLGQFGGPRGIARVGVGLSAGNETPVAELAVVENDNGRIQIVSPRSGAATRILRLVGRDGLPVHLHAPGGCATVSGKWARDPWAFQRPVEQQRDELGLLAVPSFAQPDGGSGCVHIIHLLTGVVQHTLEVP